MKTNTINNVGFGSKFIHYKHIKGYNSIKQKYVPKQVSFVEIDANNIEDVSAINKIAEEWKHGIYVQQIATVLKQMELKNPFLKTRIFVLTSQRDKFKKLNPEKILGITQVTKNNSSYVDLNYIETKPDTTYAKNKRQYKQIGSKIIDSLKEIYNNYAIMLTSVEGSTTNFYTKNGFDNIDIDNNKFIWRKK